MGCFRTVFLMLEGLRLWRLPGWLDLLLFMFICFWHGTFDLMDFETMYLQVKLIRLGYNFGFLAFFYHVLWNISGAASRGEYGAVGFETIFILIWSASKILSLLIFLLQKSKPFLPSWVVRAVSVIFGWLIPVSLSVLLVLEMFFFTAEGVVCVGLFLDDGSAGCRTCLFTFVVVALFPVLGWVNRRHLGNLLCF